MQAAKFLPLVLLVFSAPISAQYYIGGYYYSCPVGLPWNDPRCLRQPIQNASPPPQEEDSMVAAPPERWGAVYIDSTTGSIGATTLASSEYQADRAAKLRCENDGSRKCVKQMTFRNSCVAVAWPNRPGGILFVQSHPNSKTASQTALKQCGGALAECEIVFESCAMP